MSHDLRRSIDLMVKSAENVGYLRSDPTHGNAHDAYSAAELSRQLRVCMREIVELRTQVSSDRATFSSISAQHVQRIKEEVMLFVQTQQHTLQRDVREVETFVKNRLSEKDNEVGQDKKRLDDALRSVKVCSRDIFDVQETMRDALDEMRGRVDAAVAMCTSAKVESTLELERERGAMQHRLDLELSRYADLYRKQQHDVEETKRALSREVERVSATIRTHVDDVWQEKARQFVARHAELDERLASTIENLKKEVAAVAQESQSTSKALTKEVAALQASVSERLANTESVLPVVLSKMDKCERRVESVLESNGKQAATLDVFRDTCDRAAAVAARTADRLQRLDDTSSDRDLRLASVEAQMIQLAGVESFRLELDALKRTISRLDHVADAAMKAADRSEKAADDSRRLVDAAVEKCDTADKKTSRIAAKLEGAEQRVTAFAERLVVLEDHRDQSVNTTSRIEEAVQSVATKQASIESKLQLFGDRQENSAKELRVKVSTTEAQLAELVDQVNKVVEASDHFNRENDRLSKRVAKCETTLFNSAENFHSVKSTQDATSRLVDALTTRLDTAERSVVALSSVSSQLQEVSRQVQQLKRDDAARTESLLATSQREPALTDSQIRDILLRAERKSADLVDSQRRSLEDRIERLSTNVERDLDDVRRALKDKVANADFEQFSSAINRRVAAAEKLAESKQENNTALSPTFRSNFTLNDRDPTSDSSERDPAPLSRAPQVQRPPLAPGGGAATTVTESAVTRKNPYQTDDSDRSASVMSQSAPPHRRPTFSSDDSSPDHSSEPRGAVREAAEGRRLASESSESSETPDRPIARVQPLSQNPFQHSPSDETSSRPQDDEAQREALRRVLATRDNPFATPQVQRDEPKKASAAAWDISDDDAASATPGTAEKPGEKAVPQADAAPATAEGTTGSAQSPSSKATADMTISLLSSKTGDASGARPGGAAAAAPEPKPAKATAAWNFDADDSEDDSEEPLGDDDLANIM